jgi:hypothetical protein
MHEVLAGNGAILAASPGLSIGKAIRVTKLIVLSAEELQLIETRRELNEKGLIESE